MNLSEILDAARKHVPQASMRSSAELCLSDAEACIVKGDVQSAGRRALASLSYSVGMLSSVYHAAATSVPLLTDSEIVTLTIPDGPFAGTARMLVVRQYEDRFILRSAERPDRQDTIDVPARYVS
jgi:hypothetical protein